MVRWANLRQLNISLASDDGWAKHGKPRSGSAAESSAIIRSPPWRPQLGETVFTSQRGSVSATTGLQLWGEDQFCAPPTKAFHRR